MLAKTDGKIFIFKLHLIKSPPCSGEQVWFWWVAYLWQGERNLIIHYKILIVVVKRAMRAINWVNCSRCRNFQLVQVSSMHVLNSQNFPWGIFCINLDDDSTLNIFVVVVRTAVPVYITILSFFTYIWGHGSVTDYTWLPKYYLVIVIEG